MVLTSWHTVAVVHMSLRTSSTPCMRNIEIPTCLLLCGSGLPSGSMIADRYAPTLHGALPQPAFRPIFGQLTLTITLASLPTSVQSDSHTISFAVTSLYNAGVTLPSCSDQHLSTAPLISNLLRHRRASALSRNPREITKRSMYLLNDFCREYTWLEIQR